MGVLIPLPMTTTLSRDNSFPSKRSKHWIVYAAIRRKDYSLESRECFRFAHIKLPFYNNERQLSTPFCQRKGASKRNYNWMTISTLFDKMKHSNGPRFASILPRMARCITSSNLCMTCLDLACFDLYRSFDRIP